jgi:hypothetical protein
MQRFVPDEPKLKTAMRYANAVKTVLTTLGLSELPADLPSMDVPKGTPQARKDFLAARKVLLDTRGRAAELKVQLPSDRECLDIQQCVKDLRREYRVAVEIPAEQLEQIEAVEHRGYTVRVYRLKDEPSPYCYRPAVFKGDQLVHDIQVRSKTAQVSREHFGLRAVDAFLDRGVWPAKQGVPIG